MGISYPPWVHRSEAATVVPLIVSHLYHQKGWRKRQHREWSKLFG